MNMHIQRFQLRNVTASLVLFAVFTGDHRLQAAPIAIANPSFEAPVQVDGGYDFLLPPNQQGTYGWTIGDSAGIYNPTALDYATAGGNGTPAGADGSQVGFVFGFGDYTIEQQLAGPDEILNNGDDPVLAANAIYRLTVAVGQRQIGNQYGATYGGYDFMLIAGIGVDAKVIARETDAVTPTPGTFVDRTIVVDSATLDPSLYGLPLTILLRKTVQNATADTDYDHVRMDAEIVPEPTSLVLVLLGGIGALWWFRRFR